MKKARPTLKKIAEAAGVCTMTVSLALRDHPKISDKTRNRVKKLADEMGYRPNPMVSTLMSHLRATREVPNSAVIAMVHCYEPDGSKSAALFTKQVKLGAQNRADELGYRLEDFWLHRDGMTPERLSQVLRTRNIQGVVVAPLPRSTSEFVLKWEYFSPVAVGYTLQHPRIHRATNHQFHTMKLSLERLTALGYRRIGVALDIDTDAKVDGTFLSAFAGYQADLPESQRVPPFKHPYRSVKNLRRWFQKHQPDVILSDEVGMRFLQTIGKKVPEEVGFANLAVPRETDDISGVYQCPELVGKAAIDLVIGQLHHNERGIPEDPKTMMMEGRWLEGSTLRDKTKDGKKAAKKELTAA